MSTASFWPHITLMRLLSDEQMFFPVFPDLPGDDDLDLRYYDDPGSYGVIGPIKHWCLLVEIVQKIPYLRPTFKVKDKDNNELLVVFYFDNDVKMPAIWEKRCKEGGVMAIMYAVAHDFLDGQHGVRVEEVENVKVSAVGYFIYTFRSCYVLIILIANIVYPVQLEHSFPHWR